MHILQRIIEDYKRGVKRGIYSCCCSNDLVIRAAMRQALRTASPLLVEATANQVNQFGGYTGMAPADFVAYVHRLAQQEGFPAERLILGGDHLGPLTWTDLCEAEAMQCAQTLVRAYAGAGFTKIHIDTSMKLADDPADLPLSDETIARRGAYLCAAAEETFNGYLAQHPDAQKPVYIVGSEVPIPGGAQEEEGMQITSPEACKATIEAFRNAFAAQGLSDAWQRVVGIVVQPGVEFGSFSVEHYDRNKAYEMSKTLDAYPNFCFEAHSTDYQSREHLRQLVEDGFLILKVGPALTFALREAMQALDCVEKELFGGEASHYREVLERAMERDPSQWKKHYHGTPLEQRFACTYSLSDRQRYYSANAAVCAARQQLFEHLNCAEIPDVLLSQYMPMQYIRICRGELSKNVEDLLCDYVIERCIADYSYAAEGKL